MDMIEDDYTLALSTKSEFGTFGLKEINGSADNELQKLTSMMPFSIFNRTQHSAQWTDLSLGRDPSRTSVEQGCLVDGITLNFCGGNDCLCQGALEKDVSFAFPPTHATKHPKHTHA